MVDSAEEVRKDKQGSNGPESKKPRHRSPNYPTVGLRDAVVRMGKFYAADGKAGAPPELAAVHIGFAKAHGQAMSVVAALKKFGLVSESNGRLIPSHRAIEIVNLPESDERRQRALKDALLSPDIYRELIEAHRATGWPKDDVLERELITYKNFNPNSVKAFVAELKDSLDFAGVSDLNALDSNEENAGMAEQQHHEEPIVSSNPSSGLPLAIKFSGKTVQRTYSFGLSEDVNAKVDITGPAQVEDLEALKDYVDILIKSWKRKSSSKVVEVSE